MTSEIDIDGTTYQCNRLRTRTQYHVVRRLTPALSYFVPLFAASQQGDEVPLGEWIRALMQAIPELSDQDSDYIIDNALAVVRFKSGDRWASLMAPNGGGLMYEAADQLDTQLRLVFEVLRVSLENFSFAKVLGETSFATPLPTAA